MQPRSQSFYKLPSRSSSSGEPGNNGLGPCDISPVRLGSDPTLVAREQQWRNRSPSGSQARQRQSTATFAAQPPPCREERVRASLQSRPAALPPGWKPAGEEFDNVVSHRLWPLDDGSNHDIVGRVADENRAAILSGKQQLHLPGDPTAATCLGASSALSQRCGVPAVLPPSQRPISGDVLLRTYQVKAVASAAARVLSPLRHQQPQHRSAENTVSLGTTTGGTLRSLSPPSAGVVSSSAQRRITSAAGRIAYLASSLVAGSVEKFPRLQQEMQKAAAEQLQRLRQPMGDLVYSDSTIPGLEATDAPNNVWGATLAATGRFGNTALLRTDGSQLLDGRPLSALLGTTLPAGATTIGLGSVRPPLSVRAADGTLSPLDRISSPPPQNAGDTSELLVASASPDDMVTWRDEDILLLAQLAGTDGVMSDEVLTEEMWRFEYEQMRMAFVQQHQHECRQELRHADGFGEDYSGRDASRLSDGGPQLSLSSKLVPARTGAPAIHDARRRSSRFTEALRQKLESLQCSDEASKMPRISVVEFDVHSAEFLSKVDTANTLHSTLAAEAPPSSSFVGAAQAANIAEGAFSPFLHGVADGSGTARASQGVPSASSPHSLAVGRESTTTENRAGSAGVKRRSDTSLERRIQEAPTRSPQNDGTVAPLTPTRRASSSLARFLGPAPKKVVPEGDTYIPPPELHLYQLYCLNTNMILIFRPVSPSVPPMYAGNFFVPSQYCDADGIPLTLEEINPNLTLQDVLRFTTAECRVKGKGIGVSLKSSPYPPIDGFIPINPSLSKTYSEARKKERALEDTLINSSAGGGDAMSTALLRKMRSQKSLFGAATSVAMKEIEASLKDSDQRLKKLLEEYKIASSYAQDKLAVAEEFIGVLNESQFLGKTVASWRGLLIYYRQAPGDADVERRENGHPIFYCRRGGDLVVYDLSRNELDNTRSVPHDEGVANIGTLFHPVYILTHKSFVISPISKRIEPDPNGDFLIGPDFDGFAFAEFVGKRSTSAAYAQFAKAQMQLRVLPTMGLVNDLDVEHILEMRRLTEWKQSHGYECSNTLKTQEISDGPHVIVMPNEIRLANNFLELMDFYREAWQCGYPLLLNPNWKVVLSPFDYLPVPFGDELSIPVVDDCGLAMVKHHLSTVGKKFDDLKDEAHHYLEELLALRKQGVTRLRVAGLYSTSMIPKVAIVVARKKLADKFYWLRRWMLFPPLFELSKLNRFDSDLEAINNPAAAATATAALSTSTADRGLRSSSSSSAFSAFQKPSTVPVVKEFELFRSEEVARLRHEFEEECAAFDALFGSEDPRFTKRLKQYTDPQLAAQASIAHDATRAQTAAPKAFLSPSGPQQAAGGAPAAAVTTFQPSVGPEGEKPFA